MRLGFPSAIRTSGIPTLLVYALSGGLLGYYYQIHRVFLDASPDNIPARTAKGFVAAAILSFLLCYLIKQFANSAIHRVLKRCVVAFGYVALCGSTAYAAYVLLTNTAVLLRYDGILSTILLAYPAFAGLSLLSTLILRFTTRSSFAASSIGTFLLVASYILIKTGSVIGVGVSSIFFLYLIVLGRLAAGGVRRLLGLRFDSALEALLISFVFGILCNYVLWYCLGLLYLLYAATAYCVVFAVSAVGLFRYGRAISRDARATASAVCTVLNDEMSRTTAALLNVTLFGLLLLVAVLTIRFPGTGDSSARMYCATVFKFAEMHGIAFLPFYQHWPLIFQPLLAEITGLAPYLGGGIAALRFFHGTVYFAFIPAIVLLCRKYGLSYRTLVVFVLIVVASSFTFRQAYFDKPSVIAFPAFISLLVLCLVMLRELKPWYIVLAGALMATIYNAKLIYLHGAVACVVAVCAYVFFFRPEPHLRKYWKAAVVSAGIFVVVSSLHFVQNIALRGNPYHPFAAGVFTTSRDYPEELAFAKIPSSVYRRTMPTNAPSQISTIQLDPSGGMYRPLMDHRADPSSPHFQPTGKSVSIVVILTTILLPIVLLFRADKLLVFCAVVSAFSLFVWFAWIGDAWRYSTFFPCIALLSAVLVGRPFLANRALDVTWRFAFYCLLVASIPIAFSSTARLPTTERMFDYLVNRVAKHESLDPGPHMVSSYLHEQSDARPVLLVTGMKVTQFGFFQPNFLYQPIQWRKNYFTNMVYLSVIKPTHLLAAGPIDKSPLIRKYPFLAEHLELEMDFKETQRPMLLYRFDAETPWDDFHTEYLQREAYVAGYIKDIQRVLNRYRRS